MRIPHQAVAAGLLIHLASLHYIFSSTSIVGDSVVVRDSTVVVKAGTTPLAVFWSLAGILLYFTLLSQKQESISVGTPSWWRRVAAFLLDFYYSLFVIAGIWALVPLGLEASRTGRFACGQGRACCYQQQRVPLSYCFFLRYSSIAFRISALTGAPVLSEITLSLLR